MPRVITIRFTRSRGPRVFFCLQVDRRGPVIVAVMWLMCPVDMEGCNARHRVLLLRFASERKEDAANSAGTAFAPRQLGSLHKLVGLAI